MEHCVQCGKEMNPVDVMVGSGPDNSSGPICGPCTSANHQAAVRGEDWRKLSTQSLVDHDYVRPRE